MCACLPSSLNEGEIDGHSSRNGYSVVEILEPNGELGSMDEILIVVFEPDTNRTQPPPYQVPGMKYHHAAMSPLTFTFQLLDKPWSQVSFLLPPGSCLQFYRA